MKVVKALTLVSLENEVSEFFLKPNKQVLGTDIKGLNIKTSKINLRG